jgi:hypothetical protein
MKSTTIITASMFAKNILDYKTNIFDELSKSVQFETITTGRKGATIVDATSSLVPLVRTTTAYNTPVQPFTKIHNSIITNIQHLHKDAKFNNALVELYDHTYLTMGYHSDQALDLAEDSYICLFSCYNTPNPNDVRTLKIKNKTTGTHSEIVLDHNSIVLFSIATNAQHLHKIVLENPTSTTDQWLGITFRLSKTFIQFINKVPYLYPTNKVLRMATDAEKKEFYKCRSAENKNTFYKYPLIEYTISPSDLITLA